MFKPATRAKSKLRLAITGPSGSGKTYGALQVAKGLGGRIAFIDTEHGSASLYSHLVAFDVLDLAPPYSPQRFIAAMQAAEAAGYDTIIIDSITHEWSGKGGCLEMNEATAKAQFRGNTWSAWSVTNQHHQAFIDAILRSKCHVIACARSKTETAQTDDGNRKKVVKLGMKTEQRDGIEYEFTTVLDLVHDGHTINATKDRTGLFAGRFDRLTPDTGKMLLDWLNSGTEPLPDEPRQQAMPPVQASAAQLKAAGAWEAVEAVLSQAITPEALLEAWEAIDTRPWPAQWFKSAFDLLAVRLVEMLHADPDGLPGEWARDHSASLSEFPDQVKDVVRAEISRLRNAQAEREAA